MKSVQSKIHPKPTASQGHRFDNHTDESQTQYRVYLHCEQRRDMRRDAGSGVPMVDHAYRFSQAYRPPGDERGQRTETINVMLKSRSSAKSDSVRTRPMRS